LAICGIKPIGGDMKYYKIKNIARNLRKEPTLAESILWRHLSNKKMDGRRFLRQHPIIYD
jgi:very-short-patch-repair endonuclease